LKDLDAMKRRGEMMSEGDIVTEADLRKVETRKGELLRLQRWLSQQEVKLVEARQTNEGLKKEIWRVRHDLKFGNGSKRFGTT
jgi:hypothetical protein